MNQPPQESQPSHTEGGENVRNVFKQTLEKTSKHPLFRKAAQIISRMHPQRPGELTQAVSQTLGENIPEQAGPKLPSNENIETARAIQREHPELVRVAMSYGGTQEGAEAWQRLFTQHALEHPDPESPYTIASYGLSAPTYINGMNYITGILKAEKDNDPSKRLIDHDPRVLILGAQTPHSVQEVAQFTQFFHPASVTLADNSAVALELAHAAEPTVMGVECNFMVPGDTQQLPKFDVALGDRILDFIVPQDGSPILRPLEQIAAAAQMIGNIGQHMSEKGGIILVNRTDREAGKLVKQRIRLALLNRALARYGLTIDHAGKALQFSETPPLEDLNRPETFTTRDETGSTPNVFIPEKLRALIIKRLPKQPAA